MQLDCHRQRRLSATDIAITALPDNKERMTMSEMVLPASDVEKKGPSFYVSEKTTDSDITSTSGSEIVYPEGLARWLICIALGASIMLSSLV